jgi:crotonobetainyl-CoA:carnitine CoA-transferase CaiB-like acyl-CoA transferase
MIDVSMLESMLSLTLSEIQSAQFSLPPMGRPIFGPVATKDGYINLSIASERTFRNLAIASEHAQWVTDPRFAQYNDRRRNWGELIDELEDWSRERTTEEVQAVFDRHGVPSSPYRTVKAAMADAQLAHRRAFAEIRDAGGTFQALNPPFRMSDTPAAASPHVASLGEHTEELLAEIGYSETQVAGGVRLAKSAPRA